MNIVIAAEKPSIAKLLSDYIQRSVRPEEIKISENPAETGSFFVGFRFERFVMSPSGEIVADTLNIRD